MQPMCIHCLTALTTYTRVWFAGFLTQPVASSDSLSLMVRVASHRNVQRPQQEVWIYPRQMELWKGLGSCDLLQL